MTSVMSAIWPLEAEMRDMLAILSDLHMQINDLQSENATVTENLEKREEALRRLRELMLGQKEAIQ